MLVCVVVLEHFYDYCFNIIFGGNRMEDELKRLKEQIRGFEASLQRDMMDNWTILTELMFKLNELEKRIDNIFKIGEN